MVVYTLNQYVEYFRTKNTDKTQNQSFNDIKRCQRSRYCSAARCGSLCDKPCPCWSEQIEKTPPGHSRSPGDQG